MRDELVEIKQNRNVRGTHDSTRNGNGSNDLDEKLTSLAVFTTSTRSAVHRIERDIIALNQNISHLLTSNR